MRFFGALAGVVVWALFGRWWGGGGGSDVQRACRVL